MGRYRVLLLNRREVDTSGCRTKSAGYAKLIRASAICSSDETDCQSDYCQGI